MPLLGIHLNLLAGPTVPFPVPPPLMDALDRIEVTHNDQGRSGFQITFQIGQSLTSFLDYALTLSPQFRTFARVIISVLIGPLPQVVMDGIITNQELNPGSEPGSSTFTLTGDDVSFMMDREERSEEHPAQNETIIANKIIARYAQYGLIPLVIPPPSIDTPTPVERIPTQQSTDLAYLQALASRYNYVFYVTPGPAPGTNIAYWGPLIRVGIPQPALSYNLGHATNVERLTFRHNGLNPQRVVGSVQDRLTGLTLPVITVGSLLPGLAAQGPDFTNPTAVEQRTFRETGLNVIQAFARAQGQTDASTREVVTATGNLDTVRYGRMLQARSLVGVRGVGFLYSGTYYVKQVTHQISQESYTQNFTLTREGLGAVPPLVRP